MDDAVCQELTQTLQTLDLLLARYEPMRERPWPVAERSSLATDDARTAPYQISHAVQHAVQVAMDHLRCLRSALVQQQTAEQAVVLLATHGQHTLLRGALENSARAVWLLAPGNRLERIRRRLALQADDHRNNRAMAKATAAAFSTSSHPIDPDQMIKRTEQEQTDQLIALLQTAGATDTQQSWKAQLKFPGYADVVRTAGGVLQQPENAAERVDMGSVLQLAWKACSALAHGDLSGSLNQLNREVTAEQGAVLQLRLTGSAADLRWQTQLACLTVLKALDLFGQRAARTF